MEDRKSPPPPPGFTEKQLADIKRDAAEFVQRPDETQPPAVVDTFESPFTFNTPRVLKPKEYTGIKEGIRSEQTVPAESLYGRYKEEDTKPDISFETWLEQVDTVPAETILDREAKRDLPSKEHIQKVISVINKDPQLVSLLTHPTNIDAIYKSNAQGKIAQLVGAIQRAEIQSREPQLQNDSETHHFHELQRTIVASTLVILSKDLDYHPQKFPDAQTALLGTHNPREIVGKLTPVRIEHLVGQYQTMKHQGIYKGFDEKYTTLLDQSAQKLMEHSKTVRAQEGSQRLQR